MNVRDANAEEIDELAGIWYDGWHDAHAQIVPVGLAESQSSVPVVRSVHKQGLGGSTHVEGVR